MERTDIIKSFLDLVGMTKDERVRLIQALMDEWHLTESDIIVSPVSSSNVTEIPPIVSEQVSPSRTEELQTAEAPSPDTPAPKRRGRPKKIKEAAPAPNTEAPTSQITEAEVSKITIPAEVKKKPRGRPKKKSKETEKSAEEENATIEAAISSENIEKLLEVEQQTRSKATRRRNPAFSYLADNPGLKPLIIGQAYPFEFLYKINNKMLLSPHILNSLMPLGIYIPYQNIVFGKYRGFIVSIYNEEIITNPSEASLEAEKLPPIDDEKWAIMNSLQWSVLKTYIGGVNRMLSKVGGDSLKNNYRTSSPKSNLVCGVGNFRYTIEVK